MLNQISYFYEVHSFPNLLETFMTSGRFLNFTYLTDERILDDCQWLLERSLGRPLPRASRVIRTNWISENNFLGSYSFLSMDTERARVTVKDLAAPVAYGDRRPILFFAGEATDDFNGYSNGAVASGYRAGAEVVYYSSARSAVGNKFLLLLAALVFFYKREA